MALTINDIAAIQRLIAPVYASPYVDTVDDTPVEVWSYTTTAAEVVQIEVVCTAMKDTSAAFVSRMAKTFFYDGVTLHDGGWWGYITREYLGAGLGTCDFSFSLTDNVITVVWTGEAASDIRAEFKITVHNSVNDTAAVPAT